MKLDTLQNLTLVNSAIFRMTGKDPKCVAHHAKEIPLLFLFL